MLSVYRMTNKAKDIDCQSLHPHRLNTCRKSDARGWTGGRCQCERAQMTQMKLCLICRRWHLHRVPPTRRGNVSAFQKCFHGRRREEGETEGIIIIIIIPTRWVNTRAGRRRSVELTFSKKSSGRSSEQSQRGDIQRGIMWRAAQRQAASGLQWRSRQGLAGSLENISRLSENIGRNSEWVSCLY